MINDTDCKTNKLKHEHYPVDRKMKSKKFNKAGWKYEVAMLVHEPKLFGYRIPTKVVTVTLAYFGVS